MIPKIEQLGRTTVKPSMSPAEIAANARLRKHDEMEKRKKILTTILEGIAFQFEEIDSLASFRILPAPKCPFGLQRDSNTQICVKKGD